MYRIFLLSFLLLSGCQMNVRSSNACQSIIEIADAGKIQSSVLEDEPSLRKTFPKILETSIYTVKADLNGDGVEEVFGSFPVDTSINRGVSGINSNYALALINSSHEQGDEIKVSGRQDFINPITKDYYEKRVIKVDGAPYIVVLNATRSRKSYITQDNSPRAIWRVTGDFQLAVECEIAQFQDKNGEGHHRVLKDDERILREAKENRAPDNNPWYLISGLPGLTAFETAIAAGWDINSVGQGHTPPLWVTIYEKRLDLVEALLLNGALPNVFPKEPEKRYEAMTPTPIEYALRASEDSYNLAKVLIETAGANNLKVHNGDSALSYAMCFNIPEIVELLLKNGAKIDDLSVTRWMEFVSVSYDSAEKVLQLLVAHGMDLNKTYSFKFPVSGIKRVDEKTWSIGPEITFAETQLTLLQYARSRGDKKAETLLIQAGANP